MPVVLRRSVLFIVVALGLPTDARGQDAAERSFFEVQIRPVLVEHCIKCHGAEKQESGLRLDSREAMLAGGDNGPAIVPGHPADSLLMAALRYDGLEMPPTKPLDGRAIGAFEKWIASGAAWPEHTELVRDTSLRITDEDRRWWAFQSVVRQEPPTLESDDWSHTAIDRFVFQQLESHGLEPAPEADRTVLIRRLFYDVIGLPPTSAEVDTFVHDDDPAAWEKLVDRLLTDRRHGEHQARFWLDLVRYSESDGWKQDAYRPEIRRYRDYVVKSFHDDKPWADFVREQLAGDEIPGAGVEQLAAAGFLRLGIFEYNQRDARRLWDDIQNEVTDVTGDVFLGMSMACCRCHDHKYDPLRQADYFRLKAFFEPVVWTDTVPAATAEEIAIHDRRMTAWQDATKSVRAEIAAMTKLYNDRKWDWAVGRFPVDIQACFRKTPDERTSWEQQMAYLINRQFYEEGPDPLQPMTADEKKAYKALQERLAEFDDLRPQPLPKLMTVSNFGGPTALTMIPGRSKDAAPAADVPEVLKRRTSVPAAHEFDSSRRRMQLAEWIADPSNPLTTRVIVNRIWQQHFGRGLVETPNDFGRLGKRPTHPELLDWLVKSFVESGGSFRQLHRAILLSAVWRQSARHPDAEEHQEIDPDERRYWRAPVRRLTAEQIRDSMLFVSGELDSTSGGPSVAFDIPRRSIYVKQFRNQTESFLRMFDAANGLHSVEIRDTTTTPTQSLLLLNGTWSLERATVLAAGLQSAAARPPRDVARDAVQRVWGREPTEREMEMALACLRDEADDAAIDPQDRLVDLCHVLLNSNEFLYVD